MGNNVRDVISSKGGEVSFGSHYRCIVGEEEHLARSGVKNICTILGVMEDGEASCWFFQCGSIREGGGWAMSVQFSLVCIFPFALDGHCILHHFASHPTTRANAIFSSVSWSFAVCAYSYCMHGFQLCCQSFTRETQLGISNIPKLLFKVKIRMDVSSSVGGGQGGRG